MSETKRHKYSIPPEIAQWFYEGKKDREVLEMMEARGTPISLSTVKRWRRNPKVRGIMDRLIAAGEREYLDRRASMLAFVEAEYQNIIANKAEPGEFDPAREQVRLKALKQYAELLGLGAPKRIEHTGAQGGPMRVDLDSLIDQIATRLEAEE